MSKRSENLFEAIAGLDSDLIREAAPAAEVRPRRQRYLLRAGLIAACACLVLIGTVAAASGFKAIFGQRSTVTRTEDGSYIVEREQRLKLFDMDEFSPALRADWEYLPIRGRMRDGVTYAPDTWQEALDYVGVPLLKNSLLDGREFFQIENPKHKDYLWRFKVKVYRGVVRIHRTYEVDGVLVYLTASLYTEKYNQANTDVIGSDSYIPDGEGGAAYTAIYGEPGGSMTAKKAWTETMADGTEVLYTITSPSGGEALWYDASFVHGGVSYHLFVADAEAERTWQQYYREDKVAHTPGLDYEGVLRQVMDAFVFE